MRGAKIGPSANFVSFYASRSHRGQLHYSSTTGGRHLFGKWGGNPKNRYVGVRFSIKGETHYGWIRLSVNTEIPLHMSATITAYAYETVPNKRILAGTAERSTVRSQADDNLHNSSWPIAGHARFGRQWVAVLAAQRKHVLRVSPTASHRAALCSTVEKSPLHSLKWLWHHRPTR